jgi:hypothetical protein
LVSPSNSYQRGGQQRDDGDPSAESEKFGRIFGRLTVVGRFPVIVLSSIAFPFGDGNRLRVVVSVSLASLRTVGSPIDPRLVLRPADPDRPGEEIEFYERPDPRTASERTMTVDRLPEAIWIAVNRVHQFDR